VTAPTLQTGERSSRAGPSWSAGTSLASAVLLTRWLITKERELRPTTRRSYRQRAERHIIPRLGGKRLAELKPSHLSTAYAATMADSEGKGRATVGPATVQKINAILRSALADAMRDGYVSRNVALLVRLPKVPKPQHLWWEVSHVRAFTEYTRGPSPGALPAVVALWAPAWGGAWIALGGCHARQ